MLNISNFESELRSSQILCIVDVDPLCVKFQKSARLIYTATEAWNRVSLYTDDARDRLGYLWARYKFKFESPVYESDIRDRKILGLIYKTCFTQNLT
jgi:hypothetical protein